MLFCFLPSTRSTDAQSLSVLEAGSTPFKVNLTATTICEACRNILNGPAKGEYKLQVTTSIADHEQIFQAKRIFYTIIILTN